MSCALDEILAHYKTERKQQWIPQRGWHN